MSDKLRAAAQAALEELIASESNAWNVINDIEAALLETQMPTKICGPNLEETLNAAGFYRKKEWVYLTEQDVATIKKNAITMEWAILMADTTAKEKNT